MVPHFHVMQWPESKCLFGCECCWVNWRCVCYWPSAGVQGLRTSASVHVTRLIAWDVWRVSPVCLCCPSAQPCSCRGDSEMLETDITVAGRRVSRQAAGYPIILGTAASPISFDSSQQPDPARGRQRSSTLLPLSLSFHHLPSTLCWQQNFTLSLCALYFCHLLSPLWFSHL